MQAEITLDRYIAELQDLQAKGMGHCYVKRVHPMSGVVCPASMPAMRYVHIPDGKRAQRVWNPGDDPMSAMCEPVVVV